MSEKVDLPNDVYTEAHGRILGQLPALHRVFRLSSAWEPRDFERFVVSIWVLGYSGCLNDFYEIGAELPDEEALGVVMDWLVLRKTGSA